MKDKIEEKKPAENQAVASATPELDAEKVLKEYNEIANYQKVLANHLLGKYNDKNEYKIDDETVLQALIELPKQFQDKRDGNVYASAKVAGVVLNFKIVYDIAESFCNADLYIIETETSFDESIKHETHLGSIVEPYSPMFSENTYKEWGVYKGAEIKDRPSKLYSILHMQEEEFLFNRELTELLSQLFVLRMLPLLNGAGEDGYSAVSEFNALVQKLVKDDPTLAKDYTRLKLLLDKELQKKKKLLQQILLNQEILRNMKAYSDPLKRVKDKTFVPMVEEKGKTEKKEEKKKEVKKEEKKKAKKSAAKEEESKPAKKEEEKKKEKKEDPEWLQKLENSADPIGYTPAKGGPAAQVKPAENKAAPSKPNSKFDAPKHSNHKSAEEMERLRQERLAEAGAKRESLSNQLRESNVLNDNAKEIPSFTNISGGTENEDQYDNNNIHSFSAEEKHIRNFSAEEKHIPNINIAERTSRNNAKGFDYAKAFENSDSGYQNEGPDLNK